MNSPLLHGQEKPGSLSPVEVIADSLATLQLKGYNNNNRDIDLFLSAYSDSVAVYTFPNHLQYKGLSKMRGMYAGMFEQLTDLHCEIVDRIVIGSKVIDHERVSGFPGRDYVKAVAIYIIAHGKIQEVYFLLED